MLGLRLRNWQRAHRWFASQGRAFSLEGNFRAPRGQEVEYDNGLPPPVTPEPPINFLDAWDLELAWRRCSKQARWCLKMHYHSHLGERPYPERACQLIRKHAGLWLRHQDWRRYMREARAELTAELSKEIDNREGLLAAA